MQLVLTKLDDAIQIFDANSYEDALPIINENIDLDLILLDLELPGLSDTDALKAVREKLPLTPVVVLSGNDDGEKVQEILNLGAQGYIPKSSSADLLISSLKFVLSGGIYIPPEILSLTDVKSDTLASNKPETLDTSLTPRQLEVLGKLIHGYSNKEIGRLLDMAESTVRVHIAAILKALNVTNRTQAALVAVQKGWGNIE